jgi:diketogulonate reductase-like aldo/keto reductase
LINNQVEYHPFLNQEIVIRKAHELGMSITAYRPIAKGRVFKNDTLTQIAGHHNKSEAQVALRWIIQQGIIAIPSLQPGLPCERELRDFRLRVVFKRDGGH